MTTQTRIGAQRQQFTDAGYPTFIVEHKGERFTCFVLPLAMCPALPNFAYQSVSDDRTGISCPDDASIFGVCESIAEKFRPVVALHEIQEYWIKMPCNGAAVREIASIKKWGSVDQREYLTMRRNFFRLLVPYTEKEGYPAHKIEEFRTSLATFERVL